ncbi:EamA family transporter [Clostridium malenominatum]|uniref:EamA family transporter n=1 Tax=Clostridium malenominatum TaxID=1539 RepID=A0ABN1ILM4_9CLOT
MSKVKGIFFAMFSSAAFGLMPILAKFAYKYGINSITLVFLRFFFAWIVILPILMWRKTDLKLTKKELIAVGFTGIFTYGATSLMLFISFSYISGGLAMTMHFIYPVVVTLISIIFFKEKLYWKKAIALILSSIGVFLLVYNGEIQLNFAGVFFAMVSGISYSLYIVSIDRSSLRNIDSFKLTFYLSIAASISIFIFGKSTGDLNLKLDFRCYVLALLIAIIATVIAATVFQIGIKIIGASNASILSTFEPTVSMILGVIVLKEVVNFKIIIGCILILSSVILIAKAYSKDTELLENE